MKHSVYQTSSTSANDKMDSSNVLTPVSFKTRLKTELFTLAYPT